MDSLHRSKHLWCLKRCKEASNCAEIEVQLQSKTEGEIEGIAI
jgi:hypothetical protein